MCWRREGVFDHSLKRELEILMHNVSEQQRCATNRPGHD